MSEIPSPEPAPRRVRFEPLKLGGGARSGGIILYGAIVVVMAAFAIYMAAFVGHPLGSIQVAGPAIGATWFALRVFMILASRKK